MFRLWGHWGKGFCGFFFAALLKLSLLWRKACEVSTADLMSLSRLPDNFRDHERPICFEGLLAIILTHFYLFQVLSFPF